MSANDLLSILIQLLFIVISFTTTVSYILHKGTVRRDTAVMFSSLTLPYLIPIFTRILGIQSPLIEYVIWLIFMTQPYLLLRLVSDFRPVPPRFLTGAAVSLAITWVLLIFSQSLSLDLQRIGLLFIVGYFLVVDGYAVFVFVRDAMTTSGVARQRLRFAAAGSGLVAATLLAFGLIALLPSLRDFFTTLALSAAMFAGVTYYISFAPPRWLRRSWQYAEFRNFLMRTTHKPVGEPLNVEEHLRELCDGATRAVGGLTASVALRDEAEDRWGLRHISDYIELVNGANNGGIAARALQGLTSVYIRASDNLSSGDRRLLDTVDAETLLIAPIAAERVWGLLLVFIKHDSLFIEDDLELVRLLAQQSAIFLENRALVEELQGYSAQLEKKVEERTQELEESREQYRRIVETAQEGIWTMDTTNNITFVNAKMCELLGYTPEEMIGKSLFTFVDAESQSAAMTHREKYRQGIKHQYEFKFRRKEGSDLYALISAAPLLDDSGEYVGVLDMIADITARRQAEEEILKLNAELEQRVIERTAQLSAVNRELEAFSYSVSHDLRAPLRTLDGFSLALLEDYADRLDDEGQNYLKRIRTGSQRMGEIIEALLNLARISRAELQMKQVNLSEIVRSIETEMIEQHSMRQVEFIVQDGLEVRGDKKMLRVALTNLLNNAWKFTRKQDNPRIEFGLTDHDGKLAYFVRDNGVGFDMAHADKLFGAFQRLHHLTEFEGTGVGLATVARIIHLHGGDIWAHSTLNEGAAFYFTL